MRGFDSEDDVPNYCPNCEIVIGKRATCPKCNINYSPRALMAKPKKKKTREDLPDKHDIVKALSRRK